MSAVSAGFPAAGRPDRRPAGRLRLRGPADAGAGRHGRAATNADADCYPASGYSGHFPDALPRPDFGISIPALPTTAAVIPGRPAAADCADQPAAHAGHYPGAGSSAAALADTDAYASAGRNGCAYTRSHALNSAGYCAAANFAAHLYANFAARANGYAPAYAHALAQRDDY